MKQIKIGTCVPGAKAEEWLKGFIGKGFETFSLNFHMSLEGTDLDKLALSTEKLLAGTDSKITTIGYYCNPIQYAEHRKTLENVICTAGKFGATHVSTFAGAWEGKPVESAYEEFGKVFRELADLAEEKGVKLGIENCLMDGTWEHATCNIGFNPKAWEVMFEEVKNDNFGLEWEPTHQMVQLIDPVTELRKWCKKIVHIHGKDATIDWDAVRHSGISGAVPFVWHRMPGFGDTNWRDIISILRSNGYEDDICIEGYHDPVYSGELEMTGQLHALNYLKWCRGGDFTPTPWAKEGKQIQEDFSMKLGFITSILDGWTYEQMMDFASEQGFECVEVACWPEEKAERRYAGVSHIDAERVNQDDEYAAHIMAYAEKAGVEISALAYYPNVMTADKEKRNAAIEHLKNVIRASKKLGVGMVTTFIGRDQTKNVRENLELVKEIWPPIIKLAEVCDVKIAIENCPMLFGEEQWPGGQNLMTTPPIWREVFKILNSDNLGINYDPSHFIWQMIDYIRPLYEFKDKIFHVHYKDIKIYKDKLESCGIMAYPLEYMSPKIPGLGDVDWGKYVSALTDIGYDGCTCIEIEDKAFEDSKEKVEKSLILSKRYLEKYVI